MSFFKILEFSKCHQNSQILKNPSFGCSPNVFVIVIVFGIVFLAVLKNVTLKCKKEEKVRSLPCGSNNNDKSKSKGGRARGHAWLDGMSASIQVNLDDDA